MIRKSYEELVAEGVSPNMAEILSSGKAPGSRTTDDFLKGRHSGYGTDDKYLIAKLKKAGAPENGVYCPGLAKFPGDPRAVVSSMDDVKRRCAETGAGLEAPGVTILRRQVEPEMPKGPAPDILAREVRKEIAKDPAKGEKKRIRETREAVASRIIGKARRDAA